MKYQIPSSCQFYLVLQLVHFDAKHYDTDLYFKRSKTEIAASVQETNFKNSFIKACISRD